MTAVLELDAVSAGYGPFRAMFQVSLSIPDGGAVALLGPNGAGKTTVARVCSGLVQPTEGDVVFAGRVVNGSSAHELARLGVAHAVEGRSVFASLTVEENLVIGLRQMLGRKATPAALHHAYELFPRLGERRQQVAGTLSGGEQRMLSLARVLVLSPRLLIADELSLGLAPVIVTEVYRTLARIRSEGTALLVIEQQVAHALELCDDAVVLGKGTVAYHGPSADEQAIAAHLLPSGGGTAADAHGETA